MLISVWLALPTLLPDSGLTPGLSMCERNNIRTQAAARRREASAQLTSRGEALRSRASLTGDLLTAAAGKGRRGPSLTHKAQRLVSARQRQRVALGGAAAAAAGTSFAVFSFASFAGASGAPLFVWCSVPHPQPTLLVSASDHALVYGNTFGLTLCCRSLRMMWMCRRQSTGICQFRDG